MAKTTNGNMVAMIVSDIKSLLIVFILLLFLVIINGYANIDSNDTIFYPIRSIIWGVINVLLFFVFFVSPAAYISRLLKYDF